MPAVLIETAFLTNPSDYALLTSPAWRQKIAQEIADGIGAVRSRVPGLRISPRSKSFGVIGLFDSGLGGLTVLARVRERMPAVDVVFFADQANVPYGDRRTPSCSNSCAANLAWLDARRRRRDRHGLQYVVRGRGALRLAAQRARRSRSHRVGGDGRCSAADFGGSGVVATAATVGAGSYGRTIRSRVRRASTSSKCRRRRSFRSSKPESSTATKRVPRSPRSARSFRAISMRSSSAARTIRCSRAHFRAVLGGGVALIDPAVVQASARQNFSANAQTASGTTEYVTSGDEATFLRNVARITRSDKLSPSTPVLRTSAQDDTDYLSESRPTWNSREEERGRRRSPAPRRRATCMIVCALR